MINNQRNFNIQNSKGIDVNPEKETDRIADFIQKTVKREGFEKVIVAVSGGIDSATVLSLCVKALGRENVVAVKMPYGEQDENADLIIKKLVLPEDNVVEIDIKSTVDNFKLSILNFKSISNSQITSLKNDEKLRLGNIMARVRMIVLFDLAKKLKSLVVGTENKSEHLLGYYTRFGDEASDIEPIRYLYKTQVYQIAKYLGVPEEIIIKKPTAGLWEGQTDEGQLGFSYKQADEILFQVFEKNIPWNEVKDERLKTKGRNTGELVNRVKKRVTENFFKQEVPFHLQ